jgi:hypothetical protein
MPIPKNNKHELFAQALAKGKSQIEAYGLAGYKPDQGAASRLSTNVNDQACVSALKEGAAKRAEITVGSLIEELDEAKEQAIARGQVAAGVSTIREKGRSVVQAYRALREWTPGGHRGQPLKPQSLWRTRVPLTMIRNDSDEC